MQGMNLGRMILQSLMRSENLGSDVVGCVVLAVGDCVL